MKSELDDLKNLLNRCIEGNKSALDQFFSKYSNLVYRYVQQTYMANSIPFDEDDLKEQHNNVFVQLYCNNCWKLKQFQGKNGCSLASWIRLITCRTVLNNLRENSIDATWQKKRVPIEDALEIMDEEETALEFMENTELRILIQKSIQKLTPRDRLFIKLHIEQDLSVPKIASIMRISVANAHTLKHRAMERLRDLIKNNSKEKF